MSHGAKILFKNQRPPVGPGVFLIPPALQVVADFGGKYHEKGFPENAAKKPLRVFYMPSEAF